MPTRDRGTVNYPGYFGESGPVVPSIESMSNEELIQLVNKEVHSNFLSVYKPAFLRLDTTHRRVWVLEICCPMLFTVHGQEWPNWIFTDSLHKP